MPEGVGYRDYRGVEGIVEDAVAGDEPLQETVEAVERATRRSNGVTTKQVMRTERKPAANEGVRAFGAPMSTGAAERQTTDRAN